MGLLMSILITCVGVIELVAFYANVRQRLQLQYTQSTDQQQHNLGSVTQNYLDQLIRERNRLRNEIARLESLRIERSLKESTSTSINNPDDEYANSPNYVDLNHPIVFPNYTDGGGNKPSISLNAPNEETAIVYDGNFGFEHEHNKPRESSPFPTYERMAPRGSICELVSDPTVDVAEIDEENYRSRTPSTSGTKSQEFLKSQFDSHQFWERRSRSKTPDEILRENLLDFDRRSKSPSPCRHLKTDNKEGQRSRSPFDKVVEFYESTESESDTNLSLENEILDSVDGLLVAKSPERRHFKEKKRKYVQKEDANSAGEPFWVKPKK